MAFKAARGAVERIERRLDGRRAAAAHGHDKRRGGVPAGGQHTAGGEGFLHRRGARDLAVAALGERLAGGVEVDDQFVVHPVDENGGAVRLAAGIGAAAALVADAVDDRILGGERRHAGVAHGFIAHHAVHHEIPVGIDQVLPVDRIDVVIEVAQVAARGPQQRHQHAVGRAQLEVEGHHVAHAAAHHHGVLGGVDDLITETHQLRSRERRETARAGDDQGIGVFPDIHVEALPVPVRTIPADKANKKRTFTRKNAKAQRGTGQLCAFAPLR